MTDKIYMPSDDGFDASKKELAIAFTGDRSLAPSELRRVYDVMGFRDQRTGDSLYPEGYVVSGLVPTVNIVTNVLPYSEDFSKWQARNGILVQTNATADRNGDLKATRLTAISGQDSYIAIAAGSPSGQVVSSIDLQLDTTPQVELSFWDGVAEIATQTVTLTAAWQRFSLPNAVWSNSPTTLEVRVRPGPGSTAGSCFVARAQLETNTLVAGSYIATDGAPASGPGNVVSFTAGSAYAAGMVRPAAAQTLICDPLKESGIDLIYFEAAEQYFWGSVYPELDNPTTGGYGNDSVREATQLVLTDTTNAGPIIDTTITNPQYRWKQAVPIYQFDRATGIVTAASPHNLIDIGGTTGQMDGSRILPRSIPDDRFGPDATDGQPGLRAAFGRRTRDANGSFVWTPSGAALSAIQDLTVTSKVSLKIDPFDGFTPDGNAHYLDAPTPVTTPLQSSTATRSNENHTYYSGTDTYKLAKTPVVAITSLTGLYEVTETVTRGAAPNGSDQLADTPVYQILSVTQGATTYVANTDYVQTGDTVDWSLGGAEPAAGTTYTVTYLYTRTWASSEYSFDSTSITFTGAARPQNTTPFSVDYTYGQNRVDLLYIGPDGVAIAQGAPSDRPAPPPVQQSTMALFEVNLTYNQLAVTLTPRFNMAVPVQQLQTMQQQIAQLAYDIAQVTTNLDLRDRNSGTTGIYVDPFQDARQFDTNAALFGTGVKQARIDTVNQLLCMGRTATTLAAAVDSGNTTFSVVNEWAGLPNSAAVTAQQALYTTTSSVLPATPSANVPPIITLSMTGWSADWWNTYANAETVNLTVRGTRFAPGETVPISIDSTSLGSATADANGEFSTTFSTSLKPNGIVTATGSLGGATASISAAPKLAARPGLIQTYQAATDGDLLYVELYFKTKSPTEPVTLAIMATQGGYPTGQILGLVTVQAGSILTNGGATRFTFPVPIPQSAGTSYALWPICNYANTLEIAKAAQANLSGTGGYAPATPYANGALVTTNDGANYATLAGQAMRFNVGTADFQSSGTLQFADLNFAAGITGMQLLMSQRVLYGANADWQFSVDSGTTWSSFDPTQEVDFGVVAHNVLLRVIGSGSGAAGVDVNVQNLLVIGYLNETASSYVQVENVLLTATNTVKCYLQAHEPTGTQIVPQASVDDGATWVSGSLSGTPRVLNDSGLTEYTYTFSFGATGTAFRGRADLSTSDATVVPTASKISFVMF